MIECLGLMGNLSIENMDWERLMKEYNLIPWLRSHITQGKLQHFKIPAKLTLSVLQEGPRMICCWK